MSYGRNYYAGHDEFNIEIWLLNKDVLEATKKVDEALEDFLHTTSGEALNG